MGLAGPQGRAVLCEERREAPGPREGAGSEAAAWHHRLPAARLGQGAQRATLHLLVCVTGIWIVCSSVSEGLASSFYSSKADIPKEMINICKVTCLKN